MQFSPKPCPPKLSAFWHRMFVEVIVCKHFSFTTCPFDKDSQETLKTLLSRATPFCQGSSFCQRPTLLPRVWNFVKLWKPFCQGQHPFVKGHLFVKDQLFCQECETLETLLSRATPFSQGSSLCQKTHSFVKSVKCRTLWSRTTPFCQGSSFCQRPTLLSRVLKCRILLSRTTPFCQGCQGPDPFVKVKGQKPFVKGQDLLSRVVLVRDTSKAKSSELHV